MNLLLAFLKLIRWPNLIFIALTQCLFFYCIIPFVYAHNNLSSLDTLSAVHFWLLVSASVFIAAAGYIINDYFDINIDLINKPDKLIIEKYIKRRWAIVFHILLSSAGFLLSCYVGYKIRCIYIPFFNLISIVALWFYSTILKKKILVGNILISLLTAWVILVITMAEYENILSSSMQSLLLKKLLKVSLIYAGFAFIISLVREVIKDMEDMPGDAKYNCKTMPIVWGIPVSKVFAGVWIVVLVSAILIMEFYVLQLGWWISVIYCILFIILPLLWVLKKLYQARSTDEYHRLSNTIKLIMLTGILSMLLFRLYI